MTNAIPTLSLHNGVQMPVLGFGVYQVPAEQVVSDALAAGYRSIDTAAAYQNEEAVGRAIAASGSREPSSNRMHNDTSPSPRCHAIAPASTSSSSEKSAKVAVGVHAQQHPRQQHGRLQVRRAFAHPAAGAAARSGGRARPSPVPCG